MSISKLKDSRRRKNGPSAVSGRWNSKVQEGRPYGIGKENLDSKSSPPCIHIQTWKLLWKEKRIENNTKVVDFRHWQPFGNSCCQTTPKCNPLHSTGSCVTGGGYVIWAENGLHISSPRPGLWKGHFSFTTKGVNFHQARYRQMPTIGMGHA